MSFVSMFQLGMMDPVQTRDLTADVDQLPAAFFGVYAQCPTHGMADEKTGFVAVWRQLAVLQAQLDYFVDTQLDAGQRERFDEIVLETRAIAERGGE